MTDARQFDAPVVILLGPGAGNTASITLTGAVGAAKAGPLLAVDSCGRDSKHKTGENAGDGQARGVREFHSSVPDSRGREALGDTGGAGDGERNYRTRCLGTRLAGEFPVVFATLSAATAARCRIPQSCDRSWPGLRPAAWRHRGCCRPCAERFHD